MIQESHICTALYRLYLPIMSNRLPHTKDFFPSSALSLSLAGAFQRAANATDQAQEGEEGSCGEGSREEAAVEQLSSENTGPRRSDEEVGLEAIDGEDDESCEKKKRKKYHRHTPEQIQEMEALFKELPHPDEKHRQQLSKRLGLSSKQVKFWFQNRRTQIKAMQERHENSVLKSEIDRLREENRCLRENAKKAFCPNCGYVTSNPETAAMTEETKIRIENAKLKLEIEKLKSPTTNSMGNINNNRLDQARRSAISSENWFKQDHISAMFGKERMMEVVEGAMEELKEMTTMGEPLWVRSVETGREILNYDEYVLLKSNGGQRGQRVKKLSIEASRDTSLLFVDLPMLLHTFMDVNQWKEIFFSMISEASTLDILCNGDSNTYNGRVQLMVGQLQLRAAMIPTREVYFVRHSKQLSPHCWAIVDVSVDGIDDAIDASLGKCRKHPSGVVIWDQLNGRCKVTWVEHFECQRVSVPSMYRSVVNSGQAFGARHWMATMQLQFERIMFSIATNIPIKDCHGVSTMTGRKNTWKLAQRMIRSFCNAVGASSCYNSWTRITTKLGDELRLATRKTNAVPGGPVGLILCVVSSLRLPVPPILLFDFIRDENRRHEWDVVSTFGTMNLRSIACISTAQDRGNAVSIHAPSSGEGNVWMIQDSCTNSYESMLVYSPVEATAMRSVMAGGDSGGVAILPSGYSILPDGMSARPRLITSRAEDEATRGEEGSILTAAFQMVANASPEATLTMEAIETVTSLVSCVLRNIRTCLECQDSC